MKFAKQNSSLNLFQKGDIDPSLFLVVQSVGPTLYFVWCHPASIIAITSFAGRPSRLQPEIISLLWFFVFYVFVG